MQVIHTKWMAANESRWGVTFGCMAWINMMMMMIEMIWFGEITFIYAVHAVIRMMRVSFVLAIGCTRCSCSCAGKLWKRKMWSEIVIDWPCIRNGSLTGRRQCVKCEYGWWRLMRRTWGWAFGFVLHFGRVRFHRTTVTAEYRFTVLWTHWHRFECTACIFREIEIQWD